jgi:1,4-alpha-glucan branching enzyme
MELNNASANSVADAPAKGPNDGTGTAFFRLQSPISTHSLTPSGIVQLDPYLEPFKGALQSRYAKAQQWLKTIDDTEGGIEKFSRVSAPLQFPTLIC